jgi:hypothetical protein
LEKVTDIETEVQGMLPGLDSSKFRERIITLVRQNPKE